MTKGWRITGAGGGPGRTPNPLPRHPASPSPRRPPRPRARTPAPIRQERIANAIGVSWPFTSHLSCQIEPRAVPSPRRRARGVRARFSMSGRGNPRTERPPEPPAPRGRARIAVWGSRRRPGGRADAAGEEMGPGKWGLRRSEPVAGPRRPAFRPEAWLEGVHNGDHGRATPSRVGRARAVVIFAGETTGRPGVDEVRPRAAAPRCSRSPPFPRDRTFRRPTARVYNS